MQFVQQHSVARKFERNFHFRKLNFSRGRASTKDKFSLTGGHRWSTHGQCWVTMGCQYGFITGDYDQLKCKLYFLKFLETMGPYLWDGTFLKITFPINLVDQICSLVRVKRPKVPCLGVFRHLVFSTFS